MSKQDLELLSIIAAIIFTVKYRDLYKNRVKPLKSSNYGPTVFKRILVLDNIVQDGVNFIYLQKSGSFSNFYVYIMKH